LKSIKHILAKSTAFLWAFLKPLGAWGVFAIAAIDGSSIGLPVDAVVGGYVWANKARLLLYVLMAAAGSALGSVVVYVIGYNGGEQLLRKRISAEKFEKIHAAFEKHPFWSLMFPAMLPPPTPFKAFALAAAVSEMRFSHYLGAIFAGRFLRFLILSLLVVKFGPNFILILGVAFRKHFYWVLFFLAIGVLGAWMRWRANKANLATARNAAAR
jgi:membrane protein YqaA with SNARE-associated domain